MYWYNPKIREMENFLPDPITGRQALRMLEGHPNSAEFLEEYRRWRRANQTIVRSMIFTGETFRRIHAEQQPLQEQSPNKQS